MNRAARAKACDAVKYGSAGHIRFLAGFGAAMLGALWGYDGWNNLTFVAGEVKNPKRTFRSPSSAARSCYFALCFCHISPIFMCSTRPRSLRFQKILRWQRSCVEIFWRRCRDVWPPASRRALYGRVDVVVAGHAAHFVLAGARVPYAMAQDGLMFAGLGKLSMQPRSGYR